MRHGFLSIDARCRDTWREAFPSLLTGNLAQRLPDAGLLWLLVPHGASVESVIADAKPGISGRPFIVLADEPGEDEALVALAAGAAGYCNGHAAAAVLQQVATVVANGGIWVGQGLMRRLLASTARVLPQTESDWRSRLSPREQEAASLLARGASNKEIARALDITERTVKAHVAAMLDKFGARDRLQLSLIINGIEAPPVRPSDLAKP